MLRSGQVAVTATGGVGGQVDKQPEREKNPAVGGGGLRIRGGIGGGQELGVDTLLAGYSKDGVHEFSAGGKLAYKVSLAPAAAFLLDDASLFLDLVGKKRHASDHIGKEREALGQRLVLGVGERERSTPGRLSMPAAGGSGAA